MDNRIVIHDRVSYAVTSREVTDEGFLKVPGHVARAGIQKYLARELGIKDGDPNRIINVYRPESEVFSEDSLASYEGTDVTLEHPQGFVDSKNYSATSKGVVVGKAERDGDFVKCNLLIKDGATIDAINSGKSELSAGYSAFYIPEQGTHDGENYEFVQKGIKINHVAVVSKARAGGRARIFDNNGVNKMIELKIGDADFEVPQEVADHIAKLTADKDKIEAERDNDRAEVKRLKEERKEDDYDVHELRKKVREMEDEKAAATKEKATKDAMVLTGKSFDGDSVDAVMRATLDSMGFDTKGKSNDYVTALFDMQLAQKATADASHKSFAKDSFTPPAPTFDARAKFIAKTKDAWKGA